MATQYDIISVLVRRSETGLYIATSEVLEGMYVAHRDLQKIIGDLPAIVERWFKIHKSADVTVWIRPATGSDDDLAIPVISLPAQIAATALGR